MKNLIDLVEIEENNQVCVVLKIKENSKMDLIRLGYFDGNEEFIRYTKGEDHIITIFPKEGEPKSWHFGRSGYIILSENSKMQQELIKNCIEKELNIYCGKSKELHEQSTSVIKNNCKDEVTEKQE